MALYVGQSVGAVKTIASASEVVRERGEGAEWLLAGVGRALQPSAEARPL